MHEKLGTRLNFDLLDEQPKSKSEQIDVLILVGAGAVKKQRGDALKRFSYDATQVAPSVRVAE